MVEIIFDEENWDKRILCSDESCIGTIGTDGKCKECGKPYEGILDVPSSAVDVPATTSIVEIADPPHNQEIIRESISVDSPADEDWDKRVLCSDESCIGTIGPDGHCKECGKPQ
jgi:hypothetical protein